jgi:hypothetical protein
MSAAPGGRHGGDLRDKIVLVDCHGWTLAFGAQLVRQVGFPDLLTDLATDDDEARAPGHVGHGTIAGEPCSVWDLGRHLGLAPLQRSLLVLERPGGLVAFRTGVIHSVLDAPRRSCRELPAGTSMSRRNLFRACLQWGPDHERFAYVLRTSALFDLTEAALIRRDWKAVTRAVASR